MLGGVFVWVWDIVPGEEVVLDPEDFVDGGERLGCRFGWKTTS